MTRRPLDPEDLDPIAQDLERYARLTADEVPSGLADRVMAEVAGEPTPRRGVVAWLLSPFGAGAGGGATRMVMVAGTMALAILAVIVAGQVGDLFRDPQIGPSPSTPVITTPTGTPSPTATPSEVPSDSPSVSPTPTPSPSSSPDTPSASPSDDDDGRETPEPSDDDHSGPGSGDDGPETPRPSDDSSGSGGGDDSD
jgi:hypothetical protein